MRRAQRPDRPRSAPENNRIRVRRGAWRATSCSLAWPGAHLDGRMPGHVIGPCDATGTASRTPHRRAHTTLSDEEVTSFVASRWTRRPRRAQRLRRRARRHPHRSRCRCCSPPSTPRCTVGVSAMTVLVALGTHAPMSEPSWPRWLGYPAGRPRRAISRTAGAQPRVARPADVRRPGQDLRGPGRRALGRAAAHTGRRPAEPSGRRARRRPRRRPGVPARGGRLLRWQQVLLPGRRRARRSSTSRTGWVR